MRANVEGYLENVDPQALLSAPLSAGLFLIAASDSYDYNEDPNLRRSLDRVANAILHDPPQHPQPLAAASLIAGLLAYSDETGNDDALTAAKTIANQQITDPSPVLVGPLTMLFRATGDERYSETARRITRKVPPENTVEEFIYASGLVTLYRETGDEAALHRSAALWRQVQPNIAGSPRPDGDTCATSAWFEWTTNLLRATGLPEYAQAAEITLYNQLLAAQSAQSGKVYSAVTLSGKRAEAQPVSDCAAAEGWALASLPNVLWGRIDNGIAVLNYNAGRASFRLRRRTTVQVYLEGDYPHVGNLVLHIEPSRETRFHLLLRVPAWARKFTVEGGGSRLDGKPGSFVDLAAEWKKGDTVRISMDLPVFTHEDPDQPGVVALQRGPQLLAVTGPPPNEALSYAPTAASQLKVQSESGFETQGIVGKQPKTLSLIPFGNAPDAYRVYLPVADSK